MTKCPRVWVLNLDCEAQLQFGASYTRGPQVRQNIQRAAAKLQNMGLLRTGDLVVDPAPDAPTSVSPKGCEGIAWCPTPQALTALADAGAELPAAPDVTVLRRVNARAFAVGLEPSFGARMINSPEEARDVIASFMPGPVVLKRELSFAGRGHRRLFETPNEGDDRWIANSFVDGLGLVCEPWVERITDYALHGKLDHRGCVTLGRPTRQHCDDKGVWQSSEPSPRSGVFALDPAEVTTLHEAAETSARALLDAGYFGPFGIDAFRWRDGKTTRFRPLVELNARFSMGWAASGVDP